MELYGAMTLQKCNKAVIATDGNCMPDAIEVAKSLGMEILYLSSTKGILSVELKDEHHNFTIVSESASNAMLFDDMWDKYIMPLSGKTISHDGLTNKIIDVNWGGLRRLSSKGRVGKISIEEFKFAYILFICVSFIFLFYGPKAIFRCNIFHYFYKFNNLIDYYNEYTNINTNYQSNIIV